MSLQSQNHRNSHCCEKQKRLIVFYIRKKEELFPPPPSWPEPPTTPIILSFDVSKDKWQCSTISGVSWASTP
jgi:hypothetical protein